MKRVDLVGGLMPVEVSRVRSWAEPKRSISDTRRAKEGISFVWSQWRRQRLPLAIFLVLCLNLVIAPVVYAAADGTLERRSAWAIGVLGFVTLGLVIYLFVVVFQPERF